VSETEYDVVIIGSGPGGYVAGIRAAQLGLKACIVEKDKPGGVCLNIGCIPSKSLIHQAELFRGRAELESLGASIDLSGFDYARVLKQSRQAADTLSKGVAYLLKKNQVPLVEGVARITGRGEVTLDDGAKLQGKNIIVATGSRPKELPSFPFDGKKILSSDHALMLKKLPKKLLILGAGAIGCEFAHIMNSFGVDVQVVEILDQILPAEDPEIATVLNRSFKKRGIEILTSTAAKSVKESSGRLAVELEGPSGKSKTTVETILVVVGRAPNTEGIGLESIGVSPERGFIPVGDYYLTSVPGVYAIGDVTSSPLLAHVASKEGEIAVEHIAGKEPEPRIEPTSIPLAVYTEPQVASFGLNEHAAKEAGRSFEKASFPYRGCGKAVAIGKTEGMVKVLFDPESGEILGAQAVGAEATELIHEMLLAKTAELLPEDIARMIHAHPTLSETVMESFRAAEGWAIHI
jgi:dihydrolipoamide dehydrogenase